MTPKGPKNGTKLTYFWTLQENKKQFLFRKAWFIPNLYYLVGSIEAKPDKFSEIGVPFLNFALSKAFWPPPNAFPGSAYRHNRVLQTVHRPIPMYSGM